MQFNFTYSLLLFIEYFGYWVQYSPVAGYSHTKKRNYKLLTPRLAKSVKFSKWLKKMYEKIIKKTLCFKYVLANQQCVVHLSSFQ